MDQGVAAVIAGVAGLVGAGFGGLATAYGARVGAQKTIEAARAQVVHQSVAEHAHWVRDQRRQVYSDLAKQHAAFTIASLDSKITLVKGHPLPDDMRDRLRGYVKALGELHALAPLWGPDDVVLKATKLSVTAGRKLDALSAWSAAVARRSNEVGDYTRRYLAAEREDRETAREFASAVSQALSAAP
ncbi:hypothetical protein ACF1AY_32585 [Streptomyces sp. NPDC014776]|uniref:hypothetical protein n=1 Tax=Streptomyces sp. NPDC014776 TaxID=3364909 RepID=UPI003700F923